MNGRIQNELLIEKRSDEKVTEMPDFVRRWYTNMKASHKTAATCRDYITKVERFLKSINPKVSDVKLSDINEDTVTSYYISTQRTTKNGELSATSDSYQLTVWCCLDNFLSYLVNSGLIERNYIHAISKPKNHDLPRINENRVLLTDRDFKKILKAIDSEENELMRRRDRAVILLFMNTGMRKTALVTMTFDELKLDERKIVVTDKGNKRHEYILNDKLVDALNDWLSVRSTYGTGVDVSENHLFISNRGKVMAPKTVEKLVEKYTTKALGKPLSPHKLRAGYCSILYNKTGDIEFVRRAVGHSNATTTQRYIVTAGAEKKRASDIMGSLLT